MEDTRPWGHEFLEGNEYTSAFAISHSAAPKEIPLITYNGLA